jgi:signal transduction histidine kinase
MATQQSELDQLISDLADKINAVGGGNDIIKSDGYFNIYDASANTTGYWRNPANGTPVFPALTNAQVGAIINYQLVVRSSGAAYHNYPYVKKLLENTIAVI